MTGAQPNPIHDQVAESEYGNDTGFAREAQAGSEPDYVGDMPDDPDEARTYRPGRDEQKPDRG